MNVSHELDREIESFDEETKNLHESSFDEIIKIDKIDEPIYVEDLTAEDELIK